ncbi:MAG: Cyclic di-GMP phosphodiesterase response regulator RpfG [Candidatus Accumulibacter regalis]|uniref:Cyclic di-GMP phosphodiesterase response regulator RpfG n=2 Tax=Candidatus Accumulibacter TaxID=327159 RepID=A0A011QNJ3_ACCRE|nr:MAG: Cyclic di-GMP phosphodiesterase response regulator RpfG [Candidatus Accumulibacter regalis]
MKEKYALMAEETNDEHYLKAATELGDTQNVVAHQPILSSNGIKVVERGVRVDSRLFERLLNHRLQVPIDESLTAEQAVTLDELRDLAEKLIDERPFYGQLAAQLSDRVTLLGAIGSIALPKPIAFRLTVARDRRGAIFGHSLQVALIALHLGIRQEFKVAELRALAAAALLQDAGMLHIDPEMLQAEHRFDAAERRQLHAHPLTSAMIVKQQPEYPQAVGRAILEHHERHDGSGYPRGLKGAEISVMGRILLLAEVVAGVLDKDIRAPERRLSLILRLNHVKFDARMSKAILRLLEQGAVDASDVEQDRRNAERLKRLDEDFGEWSQARSELVNYAAGAPTVGAFLTDRVVALERSLADAGLHPDQLKSVCLDIGDQPDALGEVAMLAREAGWQLNGIIQDVFCRFPTLESSEQPGEVAIRDWLLRLSGRLQ